jgi:hypothetical protein
MAGADLCVKQFAVLSVPAQFDNHGSPPAQLLASLCDVCDIRVSVQDRSDAAPQVADAFAVNDANFVNAFLAACFDVVRNKLAKVLRAKAM